MVHYIQGINDFHISLTFQSESGANCLIFLSIVICKTNILTLSSIKTKKSKKADIAFHDDHLTFHLQTTVYDDGELCEEG